MSTRRLLLLAAPNTVADRARHDQHDSDDYGLGLLPCDDKRLTPDGPVHCIRPERHDGPHHVGWDLQWEWRGERS